MASGTPPSKVHLVSASAELHLMVTPPVQKVNAVGAGKYPRPSVAVVPVVREMTSPAAAALMIVCVNALVSIVVVVIPKATPAMFRSKNVTNRKGATTPDGEARVATLGAIVASADLSFLSLGFFAVPSICVCKYDSCVKPKEQVLVTERRSSQINVAQSMSREPAMQRR